MEFFLCNKCKVAAKPTIHQNLKTEWSKFRNITLKRGTHLTFSAIKVLKKNVITFCLHKVLIKCRISVRKSLNITEKIRTRKILKLTVSRTRRKKMMKNNIEKNYYANNKKIKILLVATAYIMKKRRWKKAIKRTW